ncbi:MAG: hypothetical protein JNL13_07165, partial [Chitinophagaceae bacterium]|nr:hypothetical protein [Chitinophagaceae bacterium]
MNKKIKMIMILGILCLIVRNGAAQTCSVNAGVPASVCVSADSFVLSGNASGALATAPAWRFVSGPNTPVITDSTSSTTSVKGFIAGTYVFRYGAMCSDASEVADSVRITIEALPVFTAGADTFVCGSVIRMRATLPPGSSGTWAAPSSVIISSPASPSSTFSAMGTPGSCPYSFDAVWTVTQGGCTATDTVNIGYGGERTELFTPIADETICGTAYTSPATYYYGCGGTMNVTQLSGPVTTSQTYLPEPSTSYYSRFEINGMVVGT